MLVTQGFRVKVRAWAEHKGLLVCFTRHPQSISMGLDLCSSPPAHAQICDFGISRSVDQQQTNMTG